MHKFSHKGQIWGTEKIVSYNKSGLNDKVKQKLTEKVHEL